MNKLIRLIVISLVLTSSAVIASASCTSGFLYGYIKDPSGTPVSGMSVEIYKYESSAFVLKTTVLTAGDGFYNDNACADYDFGIYKVKPIKPNGVGMLDNKPQVEEFTVEANFRNDFIYTP